MMQADTETAQQTTDRQQSRARSGQLTREDQRRTQSIEEATMTGMGGDKAKAEEE